ncbi:single-stranded-DNA-specific exonuclease RecJ [Subsaximicrobium wynnwilliamsii]|uniref:Single-stranded-DNA-specific exonuclease RecJ n=1 Tax=Subsaximicrobium wynnwilliamsii TaxID=291179 RepID=A0A5C6ZDE8_9FLAO|nr:single-stranded-DNA-specific exonuclease RecJ [Subsaximicrobium wynnwilliamsii]TXD81471.1 single-stranded-DNA-specific exonuclease RecJ [Subsaximicrobium wynnwilliamsii]TXD87088.1 single-stranded-DNA-specific exonuclease RecJ [Subsaximicrobium wynnwilliamsii]TXE00826.1 single-stranded-DNA-specific exonuclease RecJ [Subsaximicrobium wynnwilliamsii]
MRWTLKPKPKPETIASLQETLQVDATVAILLAQRGIETYEAAKKFFRPSLKDLHDPFLMKDMDRAVERIEKALFNNENIMVYGDYDVDGTTSVALMSSYLKTKSNQIATYIPDRYGEGYGVSYQGIDFAHDNGFSLIIALDCGIKAIDKVNYAAEKGIDFIICDHHRPGAELPKAVAVLDPKRDDCEYPFKELCGCGVGFKLIQALASKDGKTVEDLTEYLDLVATAIGADIVPIVDENRALAYFGLQVINAQPRPGIKAIIEETKKKELTITDVVFIVAPRINAAGRMKHGNYAVTLLTETDEKQAKIYASEINEFNLDRREADRRITEEALVQIIENKEQDRLTSVVYHESWHKGVIGIVASRLTETYYRPTLVFTKSGDKLAASARSVSGFDVYNALEACSVHIEQFGGHKYAAGLTLKQENYEAFKQAFEDEVTKTIDRNLLIPEIKVDFQMKLKDITPKFHRILKQFAPFGPSNMTPIFMSEDLKDSGYGKCVGEDDKHLRLTATQGREKIVCIGFNLGDKCDLITDKKPFNAVYSIDENHWQGNVSLQLKLRDIR